MNNQIFKIRKALGLSQYEFGKEIGVGQACVSQYENNEREPSRKVAFKIVHFANTHGLKIKFENIYSEAD